MNIFSPFSEKRVVRTLNSQFSKSLKAMDTSLLHTLSDSFTAEYEKMRKTFDNEDYLQSLEGRLPHLEYDMTVPIRQDMYRLSDHLGGRDLKSNIEGIGTILGTIQGIIEFCLLNPRFSKLFLTEEKKYFHPTNLLKDINLVLKNASYNLSRSADFTIPSSIIIRQQVSRILSSKRRQLSPIQIECANLLLDMKL